MAVPDTDNFTLIDVRAEIPAYTDSLTSCFVEATGIFDPLYEGDKDKLSNFRNYNDLVILSPPFKLVPTLITPNTLDWDFEYIVGPIIDGFEIYINGILDSTIDGGQRSGYLSGLIGNTYYSITMRTYRGTSFSAFSLAMVIRTLSEPMELSQEFWNTSGNCGETINYFGFFHTGPNDLPAVGYKVATDDTGTGSGSFNGADEQYNPLWWMGRTNGSIEYEIKLNHFGHILDLILCIAPE